MGLPGAAGRWRAAIARAERSAALRAQTRRPGEAGLARVGAWMLVEAVLRVIRPAILIALIAAAAWFGWRGAETASASGWSPLPGAMAGADDPLDGALGPGEAGLAALADRIEQALSPAPGRPPDLILADAYLAAAGTLLPRETLAAAAGLGPQVEARTRALPAWLRERRLSAARRNALTRFAAMGYDPPALALLPSDAVRRRERALRLYGRLFEGLNAVIASGEGVVDLSRAPGFRGGAFHAGASETRLAARLLSLEGNPRADPLGARVLRAGEAGGLLTPSFAAALEAGADGAVGRRASIAAGALARSTSPLAAARIAGTARSLADLERSAARAREEGLVVMARADWLGPAAAHAPVSPRAPAPPPGARGDFRIAGALLGAAALLVVFAVWSSGARVNLPGSGRGSVFDAQLRRLLLGKKDQSI